MESCTISTSPVSGMLLIRRIRMRKESDVERGVSMALYNVTEALVRTLFEDAYLKKGRLVCDCSQCVDDILAIALNRLPSRYVATDLGNVYVKAQYFEPQLQSDVLRELALAANIVGRNPRHSQTRETDAQSS